MAAAPITPAPRNRTWVFQTVRAWVAASASGIGVATVRIGVRIAQAMNRPANMATPTVMPIRWPAPIRASELEAPRPVAPDAAPSLNLK